MRLCFLLALAVLVLPLSSCAKKDGDSNAVANNNSSDNMNSDSEGMGEEMMDDGMENPDEAMGDMEGMEDGMFEEMPEGDIDPAAEGDPMFENPTEAEPMPEGDIDPATSEMPPGEGDPMFESPPDGEVPAGEGEPMPEGDPMFEGAPGDFAGDGAEGGGGRGGAVPAKPTDIPGVKEGTPEYAAVDFILKVTRGETEALKPLIAEDVDGLLKKLRSAEESEKAVQEAKDLIGQVKPQSTRLEDRDTIVSFKNDKDKILQFYVRRIQGEYVVREIRVREAVERTPNRRRR